MSSRGRLPSSTEKVEGGYLGETRGAEHDDLAYKGLGDKVSLHSRAVSISPSACYVVHVFNGCCNQLYFSLLYFEES